MEHPREPFLSRKRLFETVVYNPDTGMFIFLIGKRRGRVAGTVHSRGYRRICIDGNKFAAHRLAWFYVHGKWPAALLDHINCKRDDNRIVNLREVNRLQNNANCVPRKNKTKGITSTRSNRWQAQIKCGYRNIYLGTFDTPEQAHAAYCAKARELFGDEYWRGAA